MIFCVIFQYLTMFNANVGAGSVGAGAASCYGSGSGQMMRLLAAPAPQHWVFHPQDNATVIHEALQSAWTAASAKEFQIFFLLQP
jgi:outer membrane protein assembly factor BamB